MQLSEEKKNSLNQLIAPLLVERNIELVDIQLKNQNNQNILLVTIDKDGGVKVDDCAKVSHALSLILDVEDFFSFEYILEVSSPGIFRELKNEKDFQKYLNNRVKASLLRKLNNKKNYIGFLKSFENDAIKIAAEDKEIVLQLNQLKKIQLYPEF